MLLILLKMIIFSSQLKNIYVLSRIRRNTVTNYQENLELARKETRTYALHEIWNTIFHLVRTDYQWHMLPRNFVP